MACDNYLISYTGFDNSLGDVDSIIYQPFLYYRLLCANEVSFVLLKGVVAVHLLQSIQDRIENTLPFQSELTPGSVRVLTTRF